MKIYVFWDVMICSLVDIYKHFGGSCCLNLLPEDGACKFLWNSKHLPDYTVSHPHSHHDEKLNSHRLNNSSFVGSEVLTVMVMKSTIFWDIMPCSPLPAHHLLSRWFLALLNFQPWRCRQYVRLKCGWLSTDYTVLYPRRWYSSILALLVSLRVSCQYRSWNILICK
jgi:hypothetical protein